jgi:hypothetical protein
VKSPPNLAGVHGYALILYLIMHGEVHILKRVVGITSVSALTVSIMDAIALMPRCPVLGSHRFKGFDI